MRETWNEEDEDVNEPPEDFTEFSITENEFDSVEDILCESCGEPSEHRYLLEDSDFDTILRVCDACKSDLIAEDSDRFHIIKE